MRCSRRAGSCSSTRPSSARSSRCRAPPARAARALRERQRLRSVRDKGSKGVAVLQQASLPRIGCRRADTRPNRLRWPAPIPSNRRHTRTRWSYLSTDDTHAHAGVICQPLYTIPRFTPISISGGRAARVGGGPLPRRPRLGRGHGPATGRERGRGQGRGRARRREAEAQGVGRLGAGALPPPPPPSCPYRPSC